MNKGLFVTLIMIGGGVIAANFLLGVGMLLATFSVAFILSK